MSLCLCNAHWLQIKGNFLSPALWTGQSNRGSLAQLLQLMESSENGNLDHKEDEKREGNIPCFLSLILLPPPSLEPQELFVGSPRTQPSTKVNANGVSSLTGSALALPEICSEILAVFSSTRTGLESPLMKKSYEYWMGENMASLKGQLFWELPIQKKSDQWENKLKMKNLS